MRKPAEGQEHVEEEEEIEKWSRKEASGIGRSRGWRTKEGGGGRYGEKDLVHGATSYLEQATHGTQVNVIRSAALRPRWEEGRSESNQLGVSS
eukprot:746283-Hanusia_phi.AAC.1